MPFHYAGGVSEVPAALMGSILVPRDQDAALQFIRAGSGVVDLLSYEPPPL